MSTESSRQMRQRFRAAGACSRCGGKRDHPRRKRCKPCRLLDAAATRQRAAETRAASCCHTCRKPKPDDGHWNCEPCRKIAVETASARRARRVKLHICVWCGKRRPPEGLQICRVCRPLNQGNQAAIRYRDARRVLARRRAHELIARFKRYRKYFTPVQQQVFALRHMAWPRLTIEQIAEGKGVSRQTTNKTYRTVLNRLNGDPVRLAAGRRFRHPTYPIYRKGLGA